MSYERQNNFSRVSTILGFIVDSATVASWVLSLVSTIALASQPETPQLPGVNAELGAWYQLVLLWSGLFAYIHFLRRRWAKDDSLIDPLSDSFSDFLCYDLPELKRPSFLIPFILFFALWIEIAFSAEKGSITVLFLILLLVFISGFGAWRAQVQTQDELYDRRMDWNEDTDLQERWIKRIERTLHERGYVTTEMFEDNVGLNLTSLVDRRQINWALKMYFDLYEFEQDLMLSEKFYVTRIVESDSGTKEVSIECYELSYRVGNTEEE